MLQPVFDLPQLVHRRLSVFVQTLQPPATDFQTYSAQETACQAALDALSSKEADPPAHHVLGKVLRLQDLY